MIWTFLFTRDVGSSAVLDRLDVTGRSEDEIAAIESARRRVIDPRWCYVERVELFVDDGDRT